MYPGKGMKNVIRMCPGEGAGGEMKGRGERGTPR